MESLSSKITRALIGGTMIVCSFVALSIPAFAAEIPNSVITENRDGRQLVVKTYTLAPDADPSELNEEPFELEGFTYSQISITKEEQPFSDAKPHSETLTINTEKDDLAVILEALAPTLSYSYGGYSGTLTLDHTTIKTEVAGYSARSYSYSDTKVIDNLDRNDPSYIPQTTVKNGRTLNLASIEWSVQSSDLAGDALVPTTYMATATYTGSASSNVAADYVTTATYSGDIVSSGIAAVEYIVTFLGAPIEVDTADESAEKGTKPADSALNAAVAIPYAIAILGFAGAGVAVAMLVKSKRRLEQMERLYWANYDAVLADAPEFEVVE